MLSFEKCNLYTKVNSRRNVRNLNDFVEIFWSQIKQEIPLWGCVLVTTKKQSTNIIDAICLANIYWQQRLDYSLLSSVKLDSHSSELEIYHTNYSGYIYLVAESNAEARYLILLGDSGCNLTSEQKRAIATYKQLLEEYFRLDRQKELELQRLVTLLHQVGHHLRNHLAEISIMAETIRLSSETDFCQNQAEEIKNKVVTLNSDIGKLIKLQKINSNRYDYTVMNQDIREVFQTSINEFKNSIDTKKLKIIYPQQTAFLAIDNLKLKQIFDNLLSNAIYFSPLEGTIDCYWKSFQEEIIISVCDRGKGLSVEDLRSMFLPFYSRRENGQGLGLSIVKTIILELKGNIWAENIPQGGAKISLVLLKND